MSKKTMRKKRPVKMYWVSQQYVGSYAGKIHRYPCGWARRSEKKGEGYWVAHWWEVPDYDEIAKKPIEDCRVCGGRGKHMRYWLTTKARTIHKETCQYAGDERNEGYWVERFAYLPKVDSGYFRTKSPYKDCRFCGGKGAPSNIKPGPKET